MLDYLYIDPHWILAYRTEALTVFFLGFSQYINYYFYMYAIALGYWLSPRNRPFIYLGFLFPFTILLNSVIKGIIQIPRPDASLHLVKAFGPNGFPSGDAQLSTIFWLAIFMTWRSSPWRWLCLIPISLSAFSRVYLGVHSIYDVTGGVLLGILVIYLFYRPAVQEYVSRWYEDSRAGFWIFTAITVGVYGLVYRQQFLDPFIFSFVGMLIGYGIALPWIQEKVPHPKRKYTIESYMNLAIAIILLYSFVMYTNVINLTDIPAVNYLAVLLKYAVVSFLIFAIVPKVMREKKA